MNNVIKIQGLDCANCARELEEIIKKTEGVNTATVDFMAQKVYVDCNGETLKKVEDICNAFEEVKVVKDAPISPNESRNLSGKKLKISGLCCANCGRELEEELNKIEGVAATVDFMNMQIILNCNVATEYEKAVYTITHFEDVKIVGNEGANKKGVIGEHLYDIVCIAISALFFIPAVIFTFLKLEGALKILSYIFYGVAYLAAGHKVLLATAKNILKGKVFDENFLMTIASIGAVLLGIFTGDGLFEGVAVMLLYQIGELLQGVAVGSSRRSITKLMDLKSEVATLVYGDQYFTVSPEELKIDDVILIRAGEKIPVDCVIVEGKSAIDNKLLNGEPLPRDVKVGDEILSGGINLNKILFAKVIREYKNSAVAKILDMVENSTAKKAAPEKFITKFAKYYTPLVCIAAAIVAGIVPTVICAVQSQFLWITYSDWIYKALSFLVISCPCALVISVPLSYFGGIGRAAKFGILVKGSTCLDELASATAIAYDKTGTLTEGTFKVCKYSSEKALKLCAAAEKLSSHPIAEAFKNIQSDYQVNNLEEVAGEGLKAEVEGKILLCGNDKLLRENGVNFTVENTLSTPVYVALNGEYVGVILIDDAIKNSAKQAVEELKNCGVNYSIMLTGDKKERAQNVATEVGLTDFKAELLPDQKLEEALKLKEKEKLIYVGDGINDAPVMTAANCAISMGKVGSDAAIEASDIVLVSDDLKLIPKAKRIAKGTKNIVFQNIIGSLIVKFGVMAASVFIANFPLILAIFADVGVMLIAVLNSFRTSLIK
ncbi:MAG: cadmium-translocating P-type ATPase [Clostridia bacterium]|nr:cadmium-translocating P-type ATPase [Clostridia bacterium]